MICPMCEQDKHLFYDGVCADCHSFIWWAKEEIERIKKEEATPNAD